MKKTIGYLNIIGLVCMLVVIGCASSSSTQATEEDSYDSNVVKVDNSQMELADYLRQVSGVLVSGSGNNVSVQIRGVNSFRSGATRPLFVVDGQRLGYSFQTVKSFVNVHDVDEIEVLKGADAAIYGVEGGGGVILIKTKSS